MIRLVPLLLLIGCEGGNPETLVDELRVMAMVFEPPEVAPGESTTLTTYVAAATEQGVEALSWTCTSLGEGCLEDGTGGTEVQRVEEASPWFSLELQVPPALSSVLGSDLDRIPVSAWSLGCSAALCPEPTSAELADPTQLMRELPSAGTSLARKVLWVSERAIDERAANPVLTPLFSELPADGVLDFDVGGADGMASGYGYSTAGGFTMTSAPVRDGRLELTWIAPEETPLDTPYFWVVVQDESGGTAVWTN